MSYDCPQCRSRQTVSFEMMYSQGTRTGHMSGAAVSSGGAVGIAGGRFNSQSLLANQLSPPVEPKVDFGIPVAVFAMSVILSIIVVTVISRILSAVGLSFDAGGFILFLILVVAFTGGGVFWCYQYVERNKMPDYQDRLREWSNSMVCRRCGYMWVRQQKQY